MGIVTIIEARKTTAMKLLIGHMQIVHSPFCLATKDKPSKTWMRSTNNGWRFFIFNAWFHSTTKLFVF